MLQAKATVSWRSTGKTACEASMVIKIAPEHLLNVSAVHQNDPSFVMLST